jgi:uncharacterized protein (DUF1015 family)
LSRKTAIEAGEKFHKHKNDVEFFKAKDILRAANLKPLPKSNPGVEEEYKKINENEKLHPILLLTYDEKTFIADGFHRVSAAYHISENTEIACIRIYKK